MWKNALFGVCMLFIAVQVEARAGEAAIPNRIGKASPGEWVSYKFTSDVSRKFTVVGFEEKDGVRQVILKSQTLMGRAVMNEEESSHPIPDSNILLKDIDTEDVRRSEEVIEIKGEKYTVSAFTVKAKGVPVTVYVSEEFPVFGLVRLDMFGGSLLQINEWGFGED